MNRPVSKRTLDRENLAFAGTNGISSNNRKLRFLPAFRDEDTGRIEIARLENGRPAPAHLIVGLPEEWAVLFSCEGVILALKPSITAGFLRDNVFFTREQAAAAG